MTPARRLGAFAMLLILLGACATQPPVPVGQADRERLYEIRHLRLSGQGRWELEARLAVSDGKDGGSGHLNWRAEGPRNELDFHGALGRGAWRLETDEEMAELELADGSRHLAPTVGDLVRDQVGWNIPVDALAWWVRGLAAPGAFERRELDEQGRLRRLSQRGWTIEIGRYDEQAGESLPVRLTARSGEWKVKLAIRQWSMGRLSARNGFANG